MSEQLDFSLLQCRQVFDQLSEGVYFVDTHRRITYWNPAAERLTGYSADEVIGHCCKDKILMHVDHTGKCICRSRCPLTISMASGESQTADIFLHHRDGHRIPVRVRSSPIYDEQGNVLGAVELFSNNIEQYQAEEEFDRLESMAYRDPLTDLANRRHLDIMLPITQLQAAHTGRGLGIMMIDVDHFKQFNDVHGHAMGDRALKLVAATLKHNARSQDIVGRWGGEEFQILLPDITPAQLEQVAQRLRIMVSQSLLDVSAPELRVTVSIGACMARKDDTPAGLIARADALLYQSKQRGRNRVSTEIDTPARSIA